MRLSGPGMDSPTSARDPESGLTLYLPKDLRVGLLAPILASRRPERLNDGWIGFDPRRSD